MYKRTKYKKFFYYLFLIIILLLSYYSYKYNVFTGKYIKDIFYYPFINVKDKNCDDLNNIFNSELEKENKELRDLMGLTSSLLDVGVVNASVISRNVNNWFEVITINKGLNQGIKEGMAVIDCGGFIGRVYSVTNTTSVVRLVTSNDKLNKMVVKVIYDDTISNEVMESDGNNGLNIIGIDKNARIDKGDVVVTSGVGGILPNGILIGYVDEVSYDKYMMTKIAKVRMPYQVNDILYVSVLIVG